VPEFPATVHVTSITSDAKLHYHKRLTETYYFLECGPGAKMQLDDDVLPVKPGICIMIPPGVRVRENGVFSAECSGGQHRECAPAPGMGMART
jgi:mannose-6-phosphate isomerase-like protein (cupin superfamily)